ncbi:MAG: 5'-nucleotidase C-terminal domain-containing protein [Bacteroidales bacterium]|jgi:2',3'-cyclic-nucleotide 2'-phosphodiesterase (5'-nucleotidase family)|nr:5'-nucleotidase C-terminal domain-containing protein [Bacteroidales bacterium]MDI9576321.1 5'-nucleotidase C-terminal domain-containing protein [Bacteroidota bacterium]MDD2592889.1 5'-nucleotidase C-terminal domain-containing protein [Bacteroidales bacterium]MDD3755132.1 5'-nucleotidase C-terminal domain-containing protein [Bacteroidales bacterium]MDY0401480.1 5'-nucleotidase C-terminal domain-containing protein [Bacteroidales bacterium]
MKKIYYLIFLIFIFSCTTYQIKDQQSTSKTITIDTTIKNDDNVDKWIMKYKTSLDSLMDLVIGFNKISMIKNTPESNLGNFVCDLILDFINRELKDTLEGLPCIVVLNNGGFRSSLPEGQISIRDIYSVMPFDNTLTLLKISGENMIKLAQQIIEKGGMPIGGIEIIATATTLKQTKINGNDISKNQQYWVATSNFIANGGDNLIGLMNPIKRIDTPYLIRDIIIEHYKLLTSQNKAAYAEKDGRIRYE